MDLNVSDEILVYNDTFLSTFIIIIIDLNVLREFYCNISEL